MEKENLINEINALLKISSKQELYDILNALKKIHPDEQEIIAVLEEMYLSIAN